MATASNTSSSSSLTSTSHTLTALPSTNSKSISSSTFPSNINMSTNLLLSVLDPAQRYQFIQPSENLFKSAISETKTLLDGYASTIAEKQSQRVKQERKRKRAGNERVLEEVLRVRRVHTEGFGVDQVWEQARRVIDALREEIQREVEELGLKREEAAVNGDGALKAVKFDTDGFEVESGDESREEDGESLDIDENGKEENFEKGDELNDEDVLSAMDDIEEENMFDNEDEKGEDDSEEEVEDGGVFVPDPNGLNDGFFSIDDFNKQTEFLEQQDTTANPYTGEASDEEEIDWDADPQETIPSKPSSSSRRAKAMLIEDSEDEEDAADEEEDDGPTFGNVDLYAPEGDSEDEDPDMQDDLDETGENTNEVMYKDFFAPPPRQADKGERQAKYLERQARKPKAQPEDEESQIERAMNDVRKDLFDDESDNDDSEDALSDVDPGDPKSRKSAHERRQAKLAEEIRRLEAAAVAKREWTLSGEARAADRPLNSLLEEDLDFERTGKPVPVITAEVSESIEDLIKRRILAQEFDEVIRRRPDSESVPVNTRRGQFELDDSKPQQSLAEMYEEEHVKNADPDAYMSKADEKMKKQRQEIEGLWNEVSAKLDALSSWHYKPRPAAPSLTVVADVAIVSMEDAQPTTSSGMAGSESMLAPQEIYKAGKDKQAIERGEVVAGGAPVARQEMSRDEKLRRRRREKERIRKRGGEEIGNVPQSKKAREKKSTVDELKRGGVKVIGKRGEVRDVEGNKIKNTAAFNGAGGFKL